MADNFRACSMCRAAARLEAGGKCATHGSTATTVRGTFAAEGRPGELGPFPAMLCGYDPSRPVPRVDAP